VHFAIVSAISIVGLIFLGTWTYTGALPVVDYVSATGKTVIPASLIVRGKEVFHIKGLMSWGSCRQPVVTQTDQDAIAPRVAREVHENGYNAPTNQIVLNDAQVYAFEELTTNYTRVFTDPTYSDVMDGV
jgi:nitric oxide reductase large subunit